jgi:hypothetical protein
METIILTESLVIREKHHKENDNKLGNIFRKTKIENKILQIIAHCTHFKWRYA